MTVLIVLAVVSGAAAPALGSDQFVCRRLADDAKQWNDWVLSVGECHGAEATFSKDLFRGGVWEESVALSPQRNVVAFRYDMRMSDEKRKELKIPDGEPE